MAASRLHLSPLEQAFEKAAVRILRKHAKEIESAATLFYTRAVGQAVEHLDAKINPAKKANKTRKQIAALRATLGYLRADIQKMFDLDAGTLPGDCKEWIKRIDATLILADGEGGAS